jgi:hypothetical protein
LINTIAELRDNISDAEHIVNEMSELWETIIKSKDEVKPS